MGQKNKVKFDFEDFEAPVSATNQPLTDRVTACACSQDSTRICAPGHRSAPSPRRPYPSAATPGSWPEARPTSRAPPPFPEPAMSQRWDDGSAKYIYSHSGCTRLMKALQTTAHSRQCKSIGTAKVTLPHQGAGTVAAAKRSDKTRGA